MTNPYLEHARKIVAQSHAKSLAARLNSARKRCYKLAMSASVVAGLGWIGFGTQFLLSESMIGSALFASMTLLAIFAAWTATLCMSFNARPSLEVAR